MSDPAPKPRPRGCLFYGCLTGIVCLVAILIAFLLGLHQLRRMINEYTDTQPTPFPAAQLPPGQLEQARRRMDAFIDAIRGGRPTPPLALTGEEINALIGVTKGAEPWRGKLHVIIEGDTLRTQVSLPLAELGLPIFRGRYLNGIGTVSLGLTNGMLQANLESLFVKGKPVPSVYMNKIRAKNLAESINENPSDSVALNRLQSVGVKDGKLILTPKPE